MEQLLTIWVDDLNQKRIPLTQCDIAANARSLFDEIQQKVGGNETFSASKGWKVQATLANSLHKN